MICRKALTAIAALCALALPSRAQFSDTYYIYGSDEVEAEWQTAQNCLGAYMAIQDYTLFYTYGPLAGIDTTLLDPVRSASLIGEKDLFMEQMGGHGTASFLATNIGHDLLSGTQEEVLETTREVYSIISQCEAHFETGSGFSYTPPALEPEPVAPPPPPASVVADLECGLRYAGIMHINQDPATREHFGQKARYAGVAMKQADPERPDAEILAELDQGGLQRAQAMMRDDGVVNYGLVLEAYQKLPECDRKYGLQSVPIPQGLEDAAFRQSRE